MGPAAGEAAKLPPQAANSVRPTIEMRGVALENNFMAGSANISELDPKAEGLPVLRESKENASLNTVMSNNFGFGGTNAVIVFQCYP